MSLRSIWIPILAASLLASCSGDKQPTAESSGSATAGPSKGPAVAKLDKLLIDEVKKGDGPIEVKVGDMVYVWYTGKLANGTVFDSHEMPDNPVGFALGSGIIPGWRQGLAGMRAGGERKLSIPSELGYGSQSQGEKIPADSDLYFDIKLAYVIEPGKEQVFDFKDTKQGEGLEAKKGSKVKIVFAGYLLTGAKAMDNLDPKKAETFTIGEGKVLSGLEYGVVGMKKWGKRSIMLPPGAAFGDRGQPPAIPPDSPMRFEVEMLDVK